MAVSNQKALATLAPLTYDVISSRLCFFLMFIHFTYKLYLKCPIYNENEGTELK